MINLEFFEYDHYKFFVHPKVYKPAEDSFLLADHLKIKNNSEVLDMGTGCGFLAILASKNARKVVAVDINPYALFNTRINLILNEIDNVEVRFSNLFTNVGENFDVIIFNPPYLPLKSKDLYDKSWASENGKIIMDFLKEAVNHLNRDGVIYIILSSLSNVDPAIYGYKAELLTKRNFFFEKIYLLLLTRPHE